MKKHTTLLLTTISIALCVLLSILMIEVIRYKEDAFVNYGAAMIIPGILFIFFLGIWIYFALQLPKEKRSFLFSKLFLVGWGVYILAKCKKTLNFVITSLATICTIEIVQLVLWVGNFDIDDVILNFSGAMIAFGILKLFEFMINTKKQREV